MLISRSLLTRHSVLPGFDLALGLTLSYIALIVLIPLSAAFLKTATMSWPAFAAAVASPRVLAVLPPHFRRLAGGRAGQRFFGLIVAWVLVRYDFPLRRLVDALVDLPFALPTAVAGIALTALYAPNGWLGQLLPPLGIKVAFTPLGVFVALTFIGLPFVVRTVQPVLEDLRPGGRGGGGHARRRPLADFSPGDPAGAAAGAADRLRARLRPRPGRIRLGHLHRRQHAHGDEITPLLIITKLEQYDYPGATAIAVVMLVVSFALLLAINALQAWAMRRRGR